MILIIIINLDIILNIKFLRGNMKNKFLIIYLLLCTSIIAKELNSAVELTTKANVHSIESQVKIDKYVSQKEKLYHTYRVLNNELKSVSNYNEELQEIVVSQKNETKSIMQQIKQIDKTKRDILPLIKNMLLSLEEFIQNDTPYLYQERVQRVLRLKKLIKRSDISIASKYRAVIEAYEIENEYGRTIETYNNILEYNGLTKSVKFLRIGRVALYYVTEDNNECAIWNNETKDWHILDHSYSMKLNSAIKIASKKGVPNLLNLPLFRPKEVI